MNPTAKYNISSANIFIEMPTGHPVGYITDLNISTNMNQQQIKNLRSEGIQSYVKGFTVNSVSASRAIIDGETFFGNYQQIIQYYTQAGNLIKTGFEVLNNILPEDETVKGLTVLNDFAFGSGLLKGNAIDYRELIDSGEKLIKNQISLAEFWAKVPFSIVAKTQVPDGGRNWGLENLIETGYFNSETKELWRIDNCSLNSRSIKLSTSDVVVMESLEIFSTSFQDYNIVQELITNGFGVKQ
jgi:hypothetical protein